ncbi:hypothetical protein, partial [Halopseudomonas sp.]|uniref:hypothetical protein n=1 Tax=Halopseudomonas sp. TaxID=2901191 RepID=UPI0035697CFA
MPDNHNQTLLEKLSKGIAYSVPILAIAAAGSALHAIGSDIYSESGYQMTAPAAEAEAEGES